MDTKTKTMTVVRYKVKDGFDAEFINAIKEYDYSKANLWRLISLDNGEYVSISEYGSIENTGDDEVTGLTWLDGITHMLEHFGESKCNMLRTKELPLLGENVGCEVGSTSVFRIHDSCGIHST